MNNLLTFAVFLSSAAAAAAAAGAATDAADTVFTAHKNCWYVALNTTLEK